MTATPAAADHRDSLLFRACKTQEAYDKALAVQAARRALDAAELRRAVEAIDRRAIAEAALAGQLAGVGLPAAAATARDDPAADLRRLIRLCVHFRAELREALGPIILDVLEMWDQGKES